MTRKKELCIRAAGILRDADLCCGRQFVVIFGKDVWNNDEHRIGKVDDKNYRIDGMEFSELGAMMVIERFLDKGGYSLIDLDYLAIVGQIVDGNTSSSGLDFFGGEASYDCENHVEFLSKMCKTTDDLFCDALIFAEHQGLGLIV